MLSFSTRMTTGALGLFLMGLTSLTSCKKSDPLSNLAGLTEFSIKDVSATFKIDETKGTIENADSLPFQTNVSALIANFKAVPNSITKIGETVQVSGTTANNFSSPVTYSSVAQDGITKRNYVVHVNVAKLDPKTVSWQQVTANGAWGPYRTSTAGFYNGKLWLIGAEGGAFGSFKGGVFSSADGATWTAVTTPTDDKGNKVPYAERQAGVFGFKNKLWLLGGLIPDIGFNFSKVTNQVWSSTDGAAWTLQTPASGDTWWKGRERINPVIFNDKLFIVGGNDYPAFGNQNTPGQAFNDVWSTTDGAAWVQATAAAAFLPRTNPAVFVYNNKIYVVGGKDNDSHFLNDVWTSTDGANWTQVTVATPFTPRWGHKVVVFKNQLFLVGGETSTTETSNEMYVSEDGGVNWNKIATGDVRALPANNPQRTLFSFFVNDNTIWMIGGQGPKTNATPVFVNDTWKGVFPE